MVPWNHAGREKGRTIVAHHPGVIIDFVLRRSCDGDLYFSAVYVHPLVHNMYACSSLASSTVRGIPLTSRILSWRAQGLCPSIHL